MTTFNQADLLAAIITPFDDKQQLNFDSLQKLTDHLLAAGNRGFVIGGTTGEAATLSHDEKISLYTRFAQIVNQRGPVIAGTGINNTQATCEFTHEVSQIPGIDAALVVAPYYNKPNQRGLLAHFTAVAEASEIPIIIYNIPGRTGITIANETLVKLAQHPRIIGVKQCTSLEDLEYLVENTPADFLVYSGEDAQALAAKAIGAQGVISVASHVYGQAMRQMYDALESGNISLAGQLQRRLTPKMQALFMYPSPAPVKAVLNAQGFQTGGCRLPIQALNTAEQAKLAQALGLESTALQQTNLTELEV